MAKTRKKRRNKYQESTLRRLKANFRVFLGFSTVFAMFCIVVLLGAGLARLYQEMLDAPWLRLEEIEISGADQVDRLDILNAMGLKRGQCTLDISTEQAAERLRKLPEIKEASVRIESHRRLVAEIVEREPAALVKCGDRVMQMDIDGILFSDTAPNKNESLPLITGLCDPGCKKGDQIGARSLEVIRQLLAAVDNSKNWLSGTAINECRWSESGFTLVLGERAVPVDIGKDAFEQKITKLRKVIKTLNERGWTDFVTGIDLDYPGKAFLEGRFPLPRPVQGPARQPS
jgi:cell division septal protein FtsQ